MKVKQIDKLRGKASWIDGKTDYTERYTNEHTDLKTKARKQKCAQKGRKCTPGQCDQMLRFWGHLQQ